MTGIWAQEGEGSEAGRPGPGGQQERKEVPMIEPRGWADSGTSEPLFSREQDPLPQAGPWITPVEPQPSLILKQNEGSWGLLCPAARVTLKLHASLHPALHTAPAALRMHHAGEGSTPFPNSCRGTEEEASSDPVCPAQCGLYGQHQPSICR